MVRGLWKFVFFIFFCIKISQSQEQIKSEHKTTKMGKRSTLKVISAVEQAEGVGARVRRSIGVMNNRSYNPFLMLDHFKVSPKAGFPQHPHRGQETITFIIKGAIAHEDFTGSKGILYPGDLQFMTAGKGIVHSEMPVNLDGDQETMVEGMQLWVDLPEHLRNCEPRYRDLRAWEIPEARTEDGKVTVRVISGSSYGVESAKDLAYTPIHYYYVTIKPNGTYTQNVPIDFNYFLYVLKGSNTVVNGKTAVPQYHNLFFNTDGEEIEVTNEGTDDVELVVVGGQVLDQKTVQYGPFVAGTQEGIQKAFVDYQYGRNGFENIKSWDSLISGGVTLDMIPALHGTLEERNAAEAKYHAEQESKEKVVNDEL